MRCKRGSTLLLFLLAGCSTHPCADISDFFQPGKMYPNEVAPYGGVWVQQQTIAPLTPTLPALVPPPAPLPGSPNAQLAPIPLPPPPPPVNR